LDLLKDVFKNGDVEISIEETGALGGGVFMTVLVRVDEEIVFQQKTYVYR
jgi:hypothetical protein